MRIFTFTTVLVFLFMGVYAQQVGTTYETVVSQNTYFDVSQPLTEIGPIPPRGASGHHLQKKDPTIPKLNHVTEWKNLAGALPKGDDPAWQKEYGSRIVTQPIVNFQGVRNDDNGGYYDLVAPPDSDGDVGPNHYFQMCNTIFEIFDKSGTSLFGPADNSTIWDGFVGDWTGTNDGDPIVLYDEQADRWLVSQFAVDTDITGGTYWILVAISTTPNPTGSYYRYAFQFTNYPDYPKFGIWRDGYYLMVQHGNGTATAAALNRTQMLAGNSTAQMISYAIPNLPGSGFSAVLPSDNDGTWAPSGSPNYFVYFSDDAWGDDPVDRLKIWEFDVNWTWPFLSSLTLTQNLNTQAFSSAFGTHNQGIIPQPGTTNKLAVMEKALMNRLQYRNFGSYQSMVCCHTVDVNGSDRAGIRWYELRKTTGDWYIYQQGTYAPGSTDNFWMASIAQNSLGDIALGYSVSSSSTNPSVRFTGRRLGDPLGVMTMGEGVLINGQHPQLGTSRWGDYTMMSVDPSDDETFWYTNEYNDDYTTWGNWIMQIGSFRMDDFCAASGGCDEFIEQVVIGSDINNSSNCDGYADYRDMVADLPVNASIDIEVTNGVTSWPTDQCGIWVDWNEDEDFEDANETITVTGSPGTGPYTATLTVPNGTSFGEKTLRIRITYNQTPAPCGADSYGEVEDYTVNITEATPNVWVGGYNHYWHQSANWSLGRIPLATDPVEIPNVNQPVYVDDYPLILQENCKSLLLESGATLQMRNQKLVVQEAANIYGNVVMNEADAVLTVYGDITWQSSSSFTVNNNSTFVNAYGIWDARNGSDLSPSMGFVDFRGTTDAYIRSYDPDNEFYNLRIYKSGGAELGLSTYSTQPLRVKNLLFVNSGALFNNYDNEDVILEGSFNFHGTFDMTLNNNSSSFIFDGTNPSLNNYSTGSGLFNNVVFSASNQAVAYTDFEVAKNLTINQGIFNANGHTITIAGNWTNSIGPAGFTEDESRVIFNGPGHQYVYGDENFNILEVNNGAALRLNSTSYDVTCNVYDWTAGGIDIVAGNFTALDLADNGLYGTYWCNPGGTLTLTQDGDHYVDLNGEIHIFGGTMTVNGGLGSSFWPYQDDALIQMTGGVLDFPDSPIRISTSSYSFTENITGGTIKTQWSFYDYRGDYTPEGGTLELYGTSDASLTMVEGSNLYNLTINKEATDISQPPQKSEIKFRDGKSVPVTRANTVTATDTIVIVNDFNLDAGTFTAPDLIIIGGTDGGDWNNNVGPDAFVEGEGTVSFVGQYIQWISTENFNILDMNKPTGDFQIWYGNEVECQSLKWASSNNGEIYMNDGTFTAWDLFETGVEGKYFLVNPNSTVNLYQDASQWTDLNAEIRIDDGTMNVIGGSGASFWPYTSDAELIMTNGTLNFIDNGIYLNGNSSLNFNVDITGGTIKTNSSFTANESEDFQPAGGTVELYGSTNANVNLTGSGFFNDLLINKTDPPKNEFTHIASPSPGQKNAEPRKGFNPAGGRANSVFATGNITVEGNMTIQSGTFDVGAYEIFIDNMLDINNGTLAMADNAGDITAFLVSWNAGSNDLITAGTFHATNWKFNEGTNAKLGTGNTAYLNNLYFPTDDDAEFGNLVAVPYAKLLNNPGVRAMYPTRVSGNFTIQSGANWNFGQVDAGMLVNGDVSIEEGASLGFSYNEFIVDGDISIAGSLSISNEAMAIVHGAITWPETGEVLINTNAQVIFDSPNHPDKGWEYIDGHLTLTEGLFEITHNSVNFGETATTDVSGGTIKSGGAFASVDPGVFEPTGGTVELTGILPDGAIHCYGGNFFYNLLINREPGNHVQFASGQPITVKNDLTIQSGILNTGFSTLFVGGNWTNNVGPEGFVENQNDVWFYGETYSHIQTDETFYNLYIFDFLTDGGQGKGGKIVDETYIEDDVIVNATNVCRILGGSLNMGNNSILEVDSSLVFNGGQLIVPDGTVADILVGANFENYNPTQAFFPGQSTFTFDGTANQEVNSNASTVYFNNLVLDNSGNLIKFDANTHVYGDFHAINGTFVNPGLSNTSTFEGDITVDANGGFLPKGIINFEGNENTVFNDQSTITSYIWGDLYIDKAADNLQVLLNSNLIILNDYSINVLTGVADLNGHTLRVTNNVTIHDGGKLRADAGAQIEVGDDASLDVLSGGTLEVIGAAGNPATVTAWNAALGHRYYFNVNAGGTISANYGVFRYMKTPYGLNVKDGAIINPDNNFTNCLFRNGQTGGGSSFLTINNDQELTISGISFPVAGCDFNVGKDNDAGHITFTDFSGAFAGEDFDWDPYNRLDWYVPTLEASPQVLEVGAPAGSVTFDVISNLDWTASESTGWFSLSPTFGTGNATITVNYDENTSVVPRSGEITLSAPEVPDVIVTVNQIGADNYISISPSNRNVSSAAGTTTFSLEANPGWTWNVTENVSWLSVSPMSGMGNATLTVNYDENESTEPRIGTIELPGGVSATVSQAGADVILTVTPEEQNVGPEAGSTAFSITSNTLWTIDENAGWLSVSPASGSGNGGFTVNYDENTGVNPRSAGITVSASGSPDIIVMVNQETYMVHEVSLPAGWSGLSSYIVPAENTITDVMAPLSPNFIILQTLDAMFYPGGTVNTIGTWDSQSAYKIKLTAGSMLNVIGYEETNKTYAMDAGWNLMPVIANMPVDASGLFSGANVKIVKDVAGIGLYWPEYSINTLGDVMPGRAYMVNMNNSGSVTFPPNTKQAGYFEIPETALPGSPWDFTPDGPASHTIAILSNGFNGVMPGDVVAVFDVSGQCFGITTVGSLKENVSISAFADDPYTASKDGFADGDNMMLKLYRPQNGEVFDMEATYDLQQPNAGTFHDNGISVITAMKVAEVGINQALANSIGLYPNPTTGFVKISGVESFNAIEIYNAAGILQGRVELNNDQETTIDLSGYSSGVYQLRFTGNEHTVVKRLIRK